MAEKYKTYQFRARDRPNSFDFSTPDDMMSALEEICRAGVRLRKDFNYLPVIGGVETLYLVGNAVVRNKTSSVSPYCTTEIICQGEPNTDLVERYGKFYRSDPAVIHF